MTPAEIIADRIKGVCTVDPADVAEAIVSRLAVHGYVIASMVELTALVAEKEPLSRPKHGDRWENRNGRAVVVASNDWPPPAPGTHESDLDYRWWSEPPGIAEYYTARHWSRQNNPERHA